MVRKLRVNEDVNKDNQRKAEQLIDVAEYIQDIQLKRIQHNLKSIATNEKIRKFSDGEYNISSDNYLDEVDTKLNYISKLLSTIIDM